MKLFSLSEFSSKALAAFKRFPFTLVWVIVSAFVLVAFVEQDADSIFEECRNITLIAILGVSWLIGAQFYVEQFKNKQLWWIKIIVLLLLIGFYFLLPEYNATDYNQDNIPYIRWVLFILAGHLALFFAPFITVWHPKAYWNYLGNMMIAIARSALFSGVLYLGLVLAMLAVQYLFDVEIKGYRYFQLFIICLGIVNTWVYLSDFPKEIQHDIHLTFYKATEVFVKFILIPLAALYIIILYAYAFKILLQWELPKGWVSYLITALAELLFIIQFIIHPVRITHESRLIRKFQPLVYWLLLPLLILLYAAIYKRVADYGITEARYFLIIIALFITGATLYLIFSRKQQLRYLPVVLAIFAMMGSFGFWGAFSVSERSQLREFGEVYNAFAKMDSTTISRENGDRFRSITRYLTDRDAYDEITEILGYNPKVAFPEADEWNLSNVILDSLNISTEKTTAFQTSRYWYSNVEDINIENYQWSRQITLDNNYQKRTSIQGYTLQWSENDQWIEIREEENILITIPLIELVQNLKALDRNKNTGVPQNVMSIKGSNDTITVQIYFSSITLSDLTSKIPKIQFIEGTVLLKIKE